MASKTVNIDVDVRYNIKAGGMSLKIKAGGMSLKEVDALKLRIDGELRRLCDEATDKFYAAVKTTVDKHWEGEPLVWRGTGAACIVSNGVDFLGHSPGDHR